MPKLRTALIAGAATLLFAGAAVAATAELHTMQVNLPDGSVEHITYVGDTAPTVAIESAEAGAYADPFAAMDRDFAPVSAMMEAQRQQALQQVAALQRQAASGAQTGKVFVPGAVPAGSSYSYTEVSTSNGQGSCTQSVEWRSDGSSNQPQVTRASSGDCGAAKSGEGGKPVPVSASQKAQPVDPRSI